MLYCSNSWLSSAGMETSHAAPGQPSRSALTAAAARAAHLIVDGQPTIFADTLAAALLGDRAEELIAYHRLHGTHPVLAGARVQVTCRSRYAEDALARAAGGRRHPVRDPRRGPRLVRLPRRPLAGRVRVFEVDHPASQEFKRAALAAAGIEVPGNVRYVPADLAARPPRPVPGRRRVRRGGPGGGRLARRHHVPDRRGGRRDDDRGRPACPGHRADRRLPAARGTRGTRRAPCTARSSRRRPPSRASRGAPASRRTRWRTSRPGRLRRGARRQPAGHDPGGAVAAGGLAAAGRARRAVPRHRPTALSPRRSRSACGWRAGQQLVTMTGCQRDGQPRPSRGSVRGSPKRASSPWSPNRVSAQTWLPRSVRTRRLPPARAARTGRAGSRRTRAGRWRG